MSERRKAVSSWYLAPDFYEDDRERAVSWARKEATKVLIAMGCDLASIRFEEPVLVDMPEPSTECGGPIKRIVTRLRALFMHPEAPELEQQWLFRATGREA